ncbi:hypothetical protein NZD88_13165 [Chryseobacterium antibioticum]|uniref:Peptidase S74 domain-containing protein n=1 Tax=Chryseobacterium pyrolae TaxID=2987481 RepID=A0ABT2IIS8_9FLAO|nr:hypothetical protein [Chryseobacterium pyrolae]MCT2408494.1 hypothetical protein [Chryseobacterium pyrolae]
MKTKQDLKKYFENGDIPKQEEFWEWQESYWHKDEKIPAEKLEYDFSKKADLISGKVPASQLPSYVDDVLEFASISNLLQLGESGKIYITTDTNKLYRWTGTRYIDITQGDVGSLQAVTDRGNETTKNIKVQGINYGGSSQLDNIIIGEEADDLSSQATYTISIGNKSKTLGNDNITIGHQSGNTDQSSQGNTIIGNFSLGEGLYSNENTIVGYSSFSNGKNSQGNTIMGAYSGNSGGGDNTMNIILGYKGGTGLGAKSGNNIIIGNNSHFETSTLENKLYIHNESPGIRTTLSGALISGDFADRFVNINGVFSITPGQMQSADSSYTKNVVAKPDGTFGWEDKTDGIPLSGTVDNRPLTGSIQYKGSDTTGYNSFGFYSKLSNNEKSGFDIQDDGTLTPLIYWIGGDNVVSTLSVYHNDVSIGSTNPTFSGLRGASYYGDYYVDGSYIQKKYADKQHSYTTKEEKTGGLWINNKPVYKKTLFFDQIPRNGEIWIDKLIEDMEVIVSNQMFTEWYALDAAFAGNQWRSKAFITLEKTHVQFEIIGAPDNDYSAIDSFTLTLEYTKKGDNPVF